ncbi:MAG: hypothetical protein ACR2NA_02075 [Solirubrobacterales bacterium]
MLLSAATLAALLTTAPLAAATLPSVDSGARPGPPVLYADPPSRSPLTVQAPFTADPLLVSGTDGYRGGEYLHQDYLFDDMGADTNPIGGRRGLTTGGDVAATSAGDVYYPTGERYAANAADIVELRVKPDGDDLVYRVTLNSVLEPDTTVVGIGIDTQAGGGPDAAVSKSWPSGAKVSSQGLDHFITAWGTGGETWAYDPLTPAPGGRASLPDGAVTIDAELNQMTIRVPRSTLDPGTATWRHVAGAGLYEAGDGPSQRFKAVPAGDSGGADEPASGTPSEAPGVFNLAFRFTEAGVQGQNATDQSAEPATDVTPIGPGVWFEEQQANRLAGTGCTGMVAAGDIGCTGSFFADVDFAKLASGATEGIHGPGTTQSRIYPSSLGLPEGYDYEKFPATGGPLQPYLIRVPEGTSTDSPTPMTWSLHSLGGTYTQYKVFSPNQLDQFGDERNNLVVTTHGHGTDGWYTDEAESDFFQVWADVDRHFNLNPDRTYLSGYSMGGYGTYKLGSHYPDLFAKAFTTVGPPARGVWLPPAPPNDGDGNSTASTNSHLALENVRWIPFLNWAGGQDQLVPIPGPTAQQNRFDELGLRSELRVFNPAEHFTLATTDAWDTARDFLGDARKIDDPSRVDYARVPAADRDKLGLVHDHAYWVSDVALRLAEGDPATEPARGLLRAESRAFGVGAPVTGPLNSAGADAGPPLAYVGTGTEWTDIEQFDKANWLEIDLDNVKGGTLDGVRARLDGTKALRITVRSDGKASVRLNLDFADGTRAIRITGPGDDLQGTLADEASGPSLTPTAGASRRTVRSSARARSSQSGDLGVSSEATETPSDDVTIDGDAATIAVPAAGTRTYILARAGTSSDSSGDDDDTGSGGDAGSGGGSSPAGTVSAAAGSGGGAGNDLAFTGLTLWPLALLALFLIGSGALLARRLQPR